MRNLGYSAGCWAALQNNTFPQNGTSDRFTVKAINRGIQVWATKRQAHWRPTLLLSSRQWVVYLCSLGAPIVLFLDLEGIHVKLLLPFPWAAVLFSSYSPSVQARLCQKVYVLSISWSFRWEFSIFYCSEGVCKWILAQLHLAVASTGSSNSSLPCGCLLLVCRHWFQIEVNMKLSLLVLGLLALAVHHISGELNMCDRNWYHSIGKVQNPSISKLNTCLIRVGITYNTIPTCKYHGNSLSTCTITSFHTSYEVLTAIPPTHLISVFSL